ncbi:MAG: hypothetical protein ABI813_08965 [Bacteroidota bacterium]
MNTALTPAGLTSEEIVMIDGKIYVNIGEKSLFKGNTAMLSTKGKALIGNLAEFVKEHDGLDVSVADQEQANGATNTGDNAMASTGSGTNIDQNTTASTSTGTGYAKNNSTMASERETYKHVAVPQRKKVQASSSESKAVAYSSGLHNKYSKARRTRSMARAIAWKRQNAVADALLKNGIPKVKLVSQLPGDAANGQKGIQVVLVHNMDQYYKHMSEAPAAGQPVSRIQ